MIDGIFSKLNKKKLDEMEIKDEFVLNDMTW